jgi:hypothetical protein
VKTCGTQAPLLSLAGLTRFPDDGARMSRSAKLLHPSTLILIAANLLPLLGIVFWHWDAFLLLVLYWMETLVIGFWTILAVAVTPLDTPAKTPQGVPMRQTSRFFLVPFFIVHAGIFMSVHFMFLWSLFSGGWAKRVHDPADFIRVVVIATGLWVPLAALFVSRGFSFLFAIYSARKKPAGPSPGAGGGRKPAFEDGIVNGFYSRIIVMHLTILAGGFVALALGSIAPLVVLVALKTGIDVCMHLKNDFPDAAKPQAVTTA